MELDGSLALQHRVIILSFSKYSYHCPPNVKKVRMYPWKSTRIKDLPDINNNDGFEIPYCLAESSKGRRRPVMGHFSEPYERPELKRNPIHNNTTASTRELSGDVTNS